MWLARVNLESSFNQTELGILKAMLQHVSQVVFSTNGHELKIKVTRQDFYCRDGLPCV